MTIACDTTFNINIVSNGLTTAKLFSNNLPRVYLATPVGEDFAIVINPEDKENSVTFEGKNAAGRQLLYKLDTQKNIYKY